MGKRDRGEDGVEVRERPSRRYREDDPDWMEHLDDRPVEVPTRLKVPGNQVARIRALISRELSERASASGAESFEESDDFELEDEEWVSPYEEVFEPVLTKGSERDIMSSRGNGATVKESGDGKRSDDKGDRDGTRAAADRVGAGDGGGDAGSSEQQVDDQSSGRRGEGDGGGVDRHRE